MPFRLVKLRFLTDPWQLPKPTSLTKPRLNDVVSDRAHWFRGGLAPHRVSLGLLAAAPAAHLGVHACKHGRRIEIHCPAQFHELKYIETSLTDF